MDLEAVIVSHRDDRSEPAGAPLAAASVMGLPFHRLDARQLVGRFVEGARAGKGGWIVTPNLDILRQYTATSEARDLILQATHRVADGLPIVWASRVAGTPLPERVPGSDLVLTLPEAAADAGLSVFLLGGNPGVADAAAARLQAMNPRLGDVGFYCPPFGFEDDPEELARIRRTLRAAQPDLVLVGLGFPKQERVIRLLRPELPGAWFAGVGISLSFLAGDQPRAPGDSAAHRARVDAPPVARAAPPVPALRRTRHPVRRQAVRLGAEAPPAPGPARRSAASSRARRHEGGLTWSSPREPGLA